MSFDLHLNEISGNIQTPEKEVSLQNASDKELAGVAGNPEPSSLPEKIAIPQQKYPLSVVSLDPENSAFYPELRSCAIVGENSDPPRGG